MSATLLTYSIPCRNGAIAKRFFHNFTAEYKNAMLACTLITKHCTHVYDRQMRRFSTDGQQPQSSRLPPLMKFPQIVWPSIFKSIRNFILSTFIIKPYLDRDFSISEFAVGSRKALETISQKIAEGDLKSLEGLVTDGVLEEVQRAVSLMNLSQREQIGVHEDDIYFSFPYQIGIIFDDEDVEQKRFVEITMVFHALRGLGLMRKNGDEPPINMGVMPEYKARISISNYRFIREYTKGVESDWTVNMLNHFKPNDELVEQV